MKTAFYCNSKQSSHFFGGVFGAFMKAVHRGGASGAAPAKRVDSFDWMQQKQKPSMIAQLEMELGSPSPGFERKGCCFWIV
jgi:hypothetical protein